MYLKIAAATALAAGVTVAAHAQPALDETPPPPTGYVALGAALAPDYPGSDDFRVLPFGAARFEIAGTTVRTEGPGVAADLIEQGPITAGPYLRYAGGRDDIEDAVVARLGDVDPSVIGGGFVRATLAEGVLGPFDELSVTGRVGADLAGTFDGAAWSASLDYGAALSREAFLAVSLSLTGFGDDYAEQLFSIDAAGAVASGLPAFDAEGGARDAGLFVILDYGIGNDWSVTGALGYSRLLGDFADSPVTDIRGSADQVFTGIALGRRF